MLSEAELDGMLAAVRAGVVVDAERFAALVAEVAELRERDRDLATIEECIEREGLTRLAGPVGTVTFVNDLLRQHSK